MIGRLTGTVLEKTPPQVVVEAGGVGYEVDVPMGTFCQLPAVGHAVVLFTHLVVREDAQLLYGFGSRAERETFRRLLKISGVGAKIALAILSGMSTDELAAAIDGENITRLSRVPGIGKKTAERLVLELRGKLGGHGAGLLLADATAAPQPSAQDDVTNALLTLGYTPREAAAALKTLPAEASVEDGIRHALKALAKP
jgi:Holliday junction DNA helicase RuvA